MMDDRRERIMLQLAELLGAVEGIRGVFRDRGELPPRDKTPGIILLDGSERIKTELRGRNFTSMPAAVFTLRPQIFLVLTPRDDVTNRTLDGQVNEVWKELSLFRMRIMDAVLNDESLVALISDNGSVVYNGYDSDMKTNSTIGAEGAQMQFHFDISYVLNPSNLS